MLAVEQICISRYIKTKSLYSALYGKEHWMREKQPALRSVRFIFKSRGLSIQGHLCHFLRFTPSAHYING